MSDIDSQLVKAWGEFREMLKTDLDLMDEILAIMPERPTEINLTCLLEQKNQILRMRELFECGQVLDDELHNRMVKTIQEGIARGQFRAVDPDQMVFTIFGMIMFYFATGPLASQIWNRDIWNAKNVAQRRRSVLDFLEHGLFLPPAAKT